MPDYFKRIGGLALWLGYLILVSTPRAQAEDGRHWYDTTYQHRITASLIQSDERQTVLEVGDGRELVVPTSSLSQCDHAFLEAFRFTDEAARLLDMSPFAEADRTLEVLRVRLTEVGLTDRDASYIARSTNVLNDRKLESLVGRWIEINGIPYEVVSVNASEFTAGYHDIFVEVDDGIARVPVGMVKEIRILPRVRGFHYQRYPRGDQLEPNPFKRECPPLMHTLLPQFRWKYRMRFDPVELVWTDAKSAEGHQRLAEVFHRWLEIGQLELYAAAAWHVHRGQRFAQTRQPEAAIQEFESAIQLVPDFAPAYYSRARVFVSLGNNISALQDLDQAIRFVGMQLRYGAATQQLMVMALRLRARIRSVERMHDGAIADATRALRGCQPDERELCSSLLVSVRRAAAIDAIDDVVAFIQAYKPGLPVSDREFAAMIDLAQKAVSYNPDQGNDSYAQRLSECQLLFANHLADKARVALDSSRFADAILHARRAIEVAPVSDRASFQDLLATCEEKLTQYKRQIAKAYTDKSEEALKAERYDNAVRFAMAAEDVVPDDGKTDASDLVARCLYARALWLHKRNEFDKCESDLSIVLSKQPKNASAYLLRGHVRYLRGNVSGSLADLDRTIEINSRTEVAFYLRAMVRINVNDRAGAISDLTKAISLNTRDSRNYYERAKVLKSTARLTEAMNDIDKAIQLDARVAEYHVLRADIAMERRDFASAGKAVSRALEISPRSREARHMSRLLESRRISQDPYYFNEDKMLIAAASIGGAWIGGKVVQSGINDLMESDKFFSLKTFGGGLKIYLGNKGQDMAIEKGIDEVLPNLPSMDKTILESVVKRFVTAVVEGDAPTLSEFVGGVGQDLTKEALHNYLKKKNPKWEFAAKAAEFMYEIYGHVNAGKSASLSRPQYRRVVTRPPCNDNLIPMQTGVVRALPESNPVDRFICLADNCSGVGCCNEDMFSLYDRTSQLSEPASAWSGINGGLKLAA